MNIIDTVNILYSGLLMYIRSNVYNMDVLEARIACFSNVYIVDPFAYSFTEMLSKIAPQAREKKKMALSHF